MTTGRPIKTPSQTFSGFSSTKRAARNGYDVNCPLYTLDGDRVVVLGIDDMHPYPIVGEVHDGSANVSWLARWNVAGQYRGTPEAASKHSFERNVGLTVDLRGALPPRLNIRIDPAPLPLGEALGRVYASALVANPVKEVAYVAALVESFINLGRMRFPTGLGICDYKDLREMTLRLLCTPGLRVEWVNDGVHGLKPEPRTKEDK